VRQDSGFTVHFLAAAVTSIARAFAPASRSGCQAAFTLELPPVSCAAPNSGLA